MKFQIISNTASDRLILVFAGWGMDPGVFRHLSHEGYDVAVVWDYRDFGIDWSVLDGYSEICVIAWSLGVYAASMACHGIENRITLRIAVNGTTHPVHNSLGIPEAVYEGTAATLDDRRLQKFFRRMCGDRDSYAHFSERAPQRPVEELRDELNAIWPQPVLANPPVEGWDRAYIGRADAIFPAVNQQRAWDAAGVPVIALDAPHYIDLQRVIDHAVIHKDLAAKRFGERRQSYERHARVQRRIVESLDASIREHRIDEHLAVCGHAVLEIGCGTGMLTRRLLEYLRPEALHLWDIAPDAYTCEGATFRACDAELAITKTLPERFDAIVSASTVQWFNSPRRFMAECGRVLRPGGWLVLSAFAKGNLEEVAQATGRSLPLLPAEEWKAMVPKGFEIVEFTCNTAELVFDSPLDVFRHLQLTGVNGLASYSGAALRRAIDNYPMRLDGRYYLTYKPFILIARKKR